MLEADVSYFKEHQEPLFSSHMLDLSEETKEDNIATCVKYFKLMAPLGLWLEMEIGITGGEEDGVDNTGVDNSKLYTQPEDILDVYSALSAVGPNFSIAAAFGNVHGVYKPGNVKLHPELLGKHQEHVSGKLGGVPAKPLCVRFSLTNHPLNILVQVPRFPWWFGLHEGRNKDRRRTWCRKNERRYWSAHFSSIFLRPPIAFRNQIPNGHILLEFGCATATFWQKLFDLEAICDLGLRPQEERLPLNTGWKP